MLMLCSIWGEVLLQFLNGENGEETPYATKPCESAQFSHRRGSYHPRTFTRFLCLLDQQQAILVVVPVRECENRSTSSADNKRRRLQYVSDLLAMKSDLDLPEQRSATLP